MSVSSDFFFMESSFKSTGTMGAQNDARGKERKTNQRQEENDITRVEDPFLKAFEMRDHAEGSNGVHHPRFGPALQQINDGRKACQNEEQANDHRNNKAHDLCSSHRRSDTTDGEVCSGHQPTADVAAENYAIIRADEVIDRDDHRKSQSQSQR